MHSRSNSAAACALAFIIICFNWPVSAQLVRQREADRIAMLERISPSVVCVMSPDGQGGGSGVLISSDGFAISNFHVTDGAGPFMKCGLNDGKLYDAVIVGIDPTGDIALIKLTGRDDFPAAIQGNSDLVQIGDEVVALGNPFLLADDFTPTVTYGIVSGIHRYQYPAGTFLEYTDCIQIDASINPGNSGGPLFDIRGNWIGINGRASFEKRGRVNSGAAYAISIRQVQLFIEHLKCGLIADHGIADFTVETLPDGRVVVSQVSEVSEAWRRGLRPQNEVVTFADRLLTSANDFQNILGIFPEGTRLPMTWRGRDGMHEATIRLRPLHAFDKAPPTRGKRRPSDPNDPESPPDHPETDGEPVVSVPDSLKAMFEDKDGYANYYFNRIRREAMLDKIRKARIPESHSGTWVLNGDTGSGPGARQFELVVGEAGAGFTSFIGPPEDGKGRSWYQASANIVASDEPPDQYGLLTGALQLRHLLNKLDGNFDDAQAGGRTVHQPSGAVVDVLITRSGAMLSRWYFDQKQSFPFGVDITIGEGLDEARLLFADWEESSPTSNEKSPILPGRIGVIDSDTEAVRWLNITEASFRTSGETR